MILNSIWRGKSGLVLVKGILPVNERRSIWVRVKSRKHTYLYEKTFSRVNLKLWSYVNVLKCSQASSQESVSWLPCQSPETKVGQTDIQWKQTLCVPTNEMASRKQLSCVNHFVGLVDNNIVIYPSSNDMYRRSIIYVIMDMGVSHSKRDRRDGVAQDPQKCWRNIKTAPILIKEKGSPALLASLLQPPATDNPYNSPEVWV